MDHELCFDSWMRDVDKMFYTLFGLSASDFDDWKWLEAFESGETPDSAFDRWAEETGMRAE